VIVGAVILIGVRRTAESFDEQATHRIDFTGLALSAAGLGAITLALNEAPAPWAIGSARFLVVIVGGVLLLAGFAIVERQIPAPLIDVAMFARRNLTGASIVVFVLDFAFGARCSSCRSTSRSCSGSTRSRPGCCCFRPASR
jgi:hypothetical protein